MKLETTKSFILTVLVGVSLLLSLGLWSYQPNYEALNNQDYVDEKDMDIGGTEVTKKEIVRPRSIIFHYYNNHYGFTNQLDSQKLYQDMQSWVLYEFTTETADGIPEEDYQVEIIFPDDMPLNLMKSIFTFNEDVFVPSWSFKRIYISFDQKETALKIQFLSSHHNQQATAYVNNSSKYELLWSYVTRQEGLSEYLFVDNASEPIYIPMGQVNMTLHSFTANSIDPNKLVNALFNNPSIVRPRITNFGETIFTDVQSVMRVQNDGRTMEYFNPISNNFERLETVDLIDLSILNINDHKGWTNQFKLVDIKEATNLLQYRMFYEGHPIYNSSGLSIINQEWHNQDLYQYQRPLFSLFNNIGGEPVQLLSGSAVLNYLETNKNYNLEEIEDIQIGYSMYEDGYYLKLNPTWFMKYNGDWKEINFDDVDLIEGGS